MLRVRVVEQAPGIWRAEIEGEEQSAAYSQAPDRALATLVRENLGRFGLAAILYESDVAEADDVSGADPVHGKSVYPVPGGGRNHVEGG